MGTDLSAMAAAARAIVSELHLECSSFLNSPVDECPSSAAEAAFELGYACSLSSDSALLLLEAGLVWDADILARSVAEGTLKHLYLLMGTRSEMEERSTEFLGLVADFQSVTRLKRAQRLLELVPDPEAAEWAPIREVVDIDFAPAQRGLKFNRSTRKRIEARWSYGGLVEHFAGIPGLEPAVVLGYIYGMQSHLVHKDSNATGMMYERDSRDPLRRDSAMLAHGARIVGDLLIMALGRTGTAAGVSSLPRDGLAAVQSRAAALQCELAQATALWHSIEYPGQPLPKEAR